MQSCVSVKSVLFLRRRGGGHAASHGNSYSVSVCVCVGGVLVCTVTPCQGLSEKRLHVLMHVRLIGLIEDFKLPIDVIYIMYICFFTLDQRRKNISNNCFFFSQTDADENTAWWHKRHQQFPQRSNRRIQQKHSCCLAASPSVCDASRQITQNHIAITMQTRPLVLEIKKQFEQKSSLSTSTCHWIHVASMEWLMEQSGDKLNHRHLDSCFSAQDVYLRYYVSTS